MTLLRRLRQPPTFRRSPLLPRICKGCGITFGPRPNEQPSRYRARKYHDVSCYSRNGQRPGRPSIPVEQRFWANVDVTDNCWLWNGTLSSQGYGVIGSGPSQLKVHRWSYNRFVGPIPADLEPDHTCNVRRCVNPDHLELVTSAENTRRRDERKTHCYKGGHPWVPANWIYLTGRRFCRPCYEARQARRFA